jgi:hypothetical protein
MGLHYHLLNEITTAAPTGPGASAQTRPKRRANSAGEKAMDCHSAGFALQDGSIQAYSEEAFQYFLEIERKRSERSDRPFLLMLIDFQRNRGSKPLLDIVTESNLFSILSLCLRDTDFMGWYREGRLAGAVLTQHSQPDGHDLSEVVRQRIGDELEKHFSPDLARRLQVRVYQLSPNINVRVVATRRRRGRNT